MNRSMSTPTIRTLGQGIYLYSTGTAADGAPIGFVLVKARIGSGKDLREARERFPLVDADGIPYSKKNIGELIKCRLQLLEDLRRTRAADGSGAGTLGAAIDSFLAAHPVTSASRKHEDYKFLLAHWRRSELAAVPVTALTRKQIREQLEAWTAAGLAPTTVNHRKRALAAVLRLELEADEDEDVIVPTDTIANVPAKRLEPRGILMPIVARILSTLPDRGRPTNGTRAEYSETKIRLTVMAWTGLAHKSLTRLERRHVNFREGKLFLPPRKKGKGAAGVWVDLLPPAIDALRQYDAAALWQKAFSRSSMYKSWQLAVTKTLRSLRDEAEKTGDKTMLEQFLTSVPDKCRPYDLRHSFLSDAYRQTGDIRAVQALGQHADLKTTERYTLAAVPERVASAIDKMRAVWFPEAQKKKDAGVVRDFQVVPKSGA